MSGLRAVEDERKKLTLRGARNKEAHYRTCMHNVAVGGLEFEPPIGLCFANRLEHLEQNVVRELALVSGICGFTLVCLRAPKIRPRAYELYDVAIRCVTLRYVALRCVSYLFGVEIMLHVQTMVSNAHPAGLRCVVAIGTQPCPIQVHDDGQNDRTLT